jgi:hypothetical protein
MANLSRNAKIQKLSNAIREYRGRLNEYDNKWVERPKPTAGKRVVDWLVKLGLPVEESIKKIQGFRLVSEMNDWLKSL